MTKHIYLTTVVFVYLTVVALIIGFTACVVSFAVTSDIFQYLLAVFNLAMLANTLRIAIDLGL